MKSSSTAVDSGSCFTLLHLSDPQFGSNHRFGTKEKLDTLATRLQEDLRGIRADPGLHPDLLIVTGDLAELGRKSELDAACRFLEDLAEFLGLPRDRVAIVPGNHDINRDYCEAYFKGCKADEVDPQSPYWPKWKHYADFFDYFYRGQDNVSFCEEKPWSFFEIPSLKVVVAGLNSTMAESHQECDHYGSVGESQLHWFRDRLDPYRNKGWLRIAAVHHNVVRGATDDNENLRDADDLKRILGPYVNLVLHGHTHDGRLGWANPQTPILSTGSTGVNREARPEEVPNQYQMIRIWAGKLCRWTRQYVPGHKKWIGDTRVSEAGDLWWDEQLVLFDQVSTTCREGCNSQGSSEQVRSQPDENVEEGDPTTIAWSERSDTAVSFFLGASGRAGISESELLQVLYDWSLLTAPQGGFFTVAGALLFSMPSRTPRGVHVDVQVDDRSRGRIINLFDLNLLELYQAMVKILSELIGEDWEDVGKRDSVGRLAVIQKYPRAAILEALVNFIIHRDYRSCDLAYLTITNTYVEFKNPGSSAYSSEELLSAEEPLQPKAERNGILIHALGRTRLNQRRGGGIIEIRGLLRRNGNVDSEGRPTLEIDNDVALNRFRLRMYARPENDRALGAASLSRGRDDFLSQVEGICRLRENEDTVIERIRPDAQSIEYLSISVSEGDIARSFPIGVSRAGVNDATLDAFLKIHHQYQRTDPAVISTLVYGGAPAPVELVRRAAAQRVRLQSFVEYQGMIDFRDYVRRHTQKLGADPLYPPGLYVPQRLRFQIGQDEAEGDALETVNRWLADPYGRFVLILGDFGTGKTFLLHELARRMGEEQGPLTPILIEMRALEKGRNLDQLVAQHLAGAGMDRIDLKAFRYMLEKGRIALLFDGFDELALRVTYDRAAEHLATLAEAARGEAKVVVTSRTQHFVSDRQVRTALGERVELLAGRRIARLQHFDETQIRHFLINRLGNEAAAEARFKTIDEVKDLLGLSQNPRMLGFIADLSDHDLLSANARGGEISAASLYQLLLERWLEHEYERHQPRGALPALTIEERWDAVTYLALRLWQRTERAINVSELTEEVTRALESLSESRLSEGVAAHQVGSGTLLVRDAEGGLSFIHQSVLEWLVARRAAEELANTEGSEVLGVREASPLMADFLRDLAGRERATCWARKVMVYGGNEFTRKNAFLLFDRLDTKVREPLRLAGQYLRGRNFSGQDLSGSDLSGCDLTSARLIGVRLKDAQLTSAQLVGADLSRADLRGADLRHADLSRARLLGADLQQAKLEGSVLRQAKLVGAAVDADALPNDQLFGAALPHPEVTLSWVATSSPCNAVAWSPNQTLLATGHADGSVRIWEFVTGDEVRRFVEHQSGVLSVAYSPDGQSLASGSGKTVRIWDLATGREQRELEGHHSAVLSVAYSPDGQTLASGSDDKTVWIWDLATGCVQRRLEGHHSAVLSVAYSPDGQTLASGSDDTVRIWDLASGCVQRRLEGHHSAVLSIAYSPDGQTLASGSDGMVRIWDLASGCEQRRLEGHQSGILSVAYSPDGQTLASGSYDHTVRIWDLARGREQRKFEGHQSVVLSVAYSPDGQSLASGSDDHTVRIWDPAKVREQRKFEGHQSVVWSVAYSPDGRTLASGSSDKTARIWDLARGREQCKFEGHQSWVLSVAYSPDGQTLASGSDDHTVRLWDLARGREQCKFEGHQSGVLSVAYSPDGQTLASGSDDKTVR
ncbi:MAG: NACHT domain-containing protein, partial [bacterium]|nr:NACHT domain-containing protein [bacterium]